MSKIKLIIFIFVILAIEPDSVKYLPIIIITFCIVNYKKKNQEFKQSEYYNDSKQSYFEILKDKGKYGEYLTYDCLKKSRDNDTKFLFNLYLPKLDGTTTEIDLVMITKKAIFVFESKNYSGWIYGDESQYKWCQILPSGKGRSRKEFFYNPIMQNAGHINTLKSFVKDQVPIYSVIVFSERCKLKKIDIKSNNVRVTHRSGLQRTVDEICNGIVSDSLNADEILRIYDDLYFYTQVCDQIKADHVNDVRKYN